MSVHNLGPALPLTLGSWARRVLWTTCPFVALGALALCIRLFSNGDDVSNVTARGELKQSHVVQNGVHTGLNNEVPDLDGSTDVHAYTGVSNSAFMPHESFLTVFGKPSETELSGGHQNGTITNLHKRDDYNEHLLCVGAQLKTALDAQDVAYLKDSSWNDPSIMFDDKYWRSTQTNGMLNTLNSEIWGEFLQENVPEKDPQMITYLFEGIAGTSVGKQMWKSLNDPSNGIQIATQMFTGKEPITGFPFRGSDQFFLQWKQASTVKGNVGNIRWIGVQELINEDTSKTLEVACPDGNPWPGCILDWKSNPRAASAVLGTPNGRFVGWMLLQHPNEFPRKTIVSVRAFIAGMGIGRFGGMWNLLFEIGDLPPLPKQEPQAGDPDVTKRGASLARTAQATEKILSEPSHGVERAKRSISIAKKDAPPSAETFAEQRAKTPQQCICTGQGVLQRILTQTDLTPSVFQDPAYITSGFWMSYEDTRGPPAGWTEFIKARKICCSQWHYFYLLGKAGSMARGAYYAAYYHLGSGTLMRTSTFRAIVNNEALVIKSNGPTTPLLQLIRTDQDIKGIPYKPSDIVFLAWKHWCVTNKKEPNILQRVLIDTVINKDTISAMQWVAFRIGKPILLEWPGITLLPGSFEFMALLGTPNGISIGWMIINHPADLRMRTITSITVFMTDTGSPMMDFEIGPLTQTLRRKELEDLPVETDDADGMSL